jgi:hypothetical protein
LNFGQVFLGLDGFLRGSSDKNDTKSWGESKIHEAWQISTTVALRR